MFRLVPSVEALIVVSTRLGWQQRSRFELHSEELQSHLFRLGYAERQRVGYSKVIVITATAVRSRSTVTMMWEPGSVTPASVRYFDAGPNSGTIDDLGDFHPDDSPRPAQPPTFDPVEAWKRRES